MLYLPDSTKKRRKNGAKEMERQISERTADLSAAHQELTAQFEELQQSQDSLQRNFRIQEVLREIAEVALTAGSLEELYAKVHQSVVRVLPAKNFFIALLEQATNEITVPYCVDETNSIPRRRTVGKGLTEYAMHQGRAVLLSNAEFERLWQNGEVNLKFTRINEWLGAPLKRSSGEIFGVIALYSIGSASPYKPEYKEIIAIIAAQVSMAIERRHMEILLEKRIISLTLPLDNPENIRFEELFNIKDIQHLQDAFSDATGVASLITQIDGTPITRPSNFCHLCSNIIRKTEKGLANCGRSDAALGALCVDGPIVKPCLSGGLWDAGAGISVGGRHIANWLIGQVRDETQTEEKMREYAREIGADEQSFLAAFNEVPSMSLDKFEKIADTLFLLAEQLSTLAYQNVQQARYITERKQVEDAMRESEERFANAFQFAVVGMSLSSPQGRWIKVNPALCRIFGYSEEELLCKSVREVTYSEDWEESSEFQRRLLEGELDHYQLEKRYVHKTGHIIWAEISVSLVSSSIGEPLYLVAQIEDISDRKRMEQELHLHARKLEKTVALKTQELYASNQELTAVNQELTAMNEEMIAMNESLQVANEDLAVEVENRQQKEFELLRREKQYRATTSLLTRPGEAFDEFLRTILQEAILLVGAPGGYIGLQDESGKNFVVSHTVGADRRLVIEPRPIEKGMLGQVYRTGEVLCVDDYRQYPNRIADPQFEQSTTVIMIPLKMGGQIKGALTANWRDTVHPISPEDIEILRQYGVLASIALERMHAGLQITYQNQLLHGLAETTAALVSELDVEKVLQNILDKARELTEIPHGFVLMVNENNVHEVFFQAGYGRYAEKVGRSEIWYGGVFEEVLRTGQMTVVEDYVNWPHRNHESVRDGVTMSMHAPLKVEGKVIGDIGLTAYGEPITMSPEKIAAFKQFASVASIAVKNALSHQKTNRLAFHDTLTGLPNRAHLNLRLEEEMRQARCGETVGTVMFIDLDDLKTVNDHFGHSFGDDVIIAAGQDIAGAVGNNTYVARVGGDEFVVLLPGKEDLQEIAQIAERLVGAIRKEYEIRGHRIHMSTSVGVTRYPSDALTTEDALKNADIAMYAAKASGKSNWCFYESKMLRDTYDQMVLTNSLRHALERGEFYLHYQPQITLSEKRVVGFEALLRWNSKEHGMIPPARFIPLAEQRGLIQSIGKWVIGEACRFARKLADLGRKDMHVAVNVSPRQLAADDFVPAMQGCIVESGIEPGQLEVEITENVLIEVPRRRNTKTLFP